MSKEITLELSQKDYASIVAISKELQLEPGEVMRFFMLEYSKRISDPHRNMRNMIDEMFLQLKEYAEESNVPFADMLLHVIHNSTCRDNSNTIDTPGAAE